MKLHIKWPIKPPLQLGKLRWAIAVALAIAVVLPAAASGQTAPRVGGWFLFGTNMPWLNWNADFGGGRNGGGVSGNISEVDSKLLAAHNAGMKIIRWWVFEGGSPQIQRDGNGTPTGLNPNVYTDIDAALAEAAKYDMSYNLVLFGSTNDDSTTHQWWENAAKRQALVQVLTPLFQRYASNPRVHTWETVNEPEWQSRNGLTSVSGMLATSDALANAIHQNSQALVTVGQAQMQDMATWKGHPLDYYSPHYYDNFGTGSNDPFVTAVNSASPDGKPVVIGEYQASSGLNPSAQSRWQTLYSAGYAGGWNWSVSPEHTGDKIPTDLNAAAAFASGKSDLGPQTTGVPPGPTATATLVPPTATATRTPVPPTATATRTPVPSTATPTRTPVPPTATPIPTTTGATATPTPASLTWTTTTSVSPSSISRTGGTSAVTVRVVMTASRAASGLVDIEIYDQTWHKVYQRWWDNEPFSGGTPRTFTTSWVVPTTASLGTYTVMVGTFAPGWSGQYAFNKSAGGFTVR